MTGNDPNAEKADNSGGSETSAFTPPQINLPKGGGAIRGVDEKFSINPVRGSGSLTIPIALSPGRSGFGPQLSLNYDSGSGNGIFGMGWSLSLPAITRRTDKGLPKYQDDEESDIFILSGAEDLVPALVPNNSGQLILDEFERDGYVIKRYRPRIEGLFARIERWKCLDSGDIHWRSISKDNILTVYGFNEESRIADPEAPDRIFSWNICRSFDDKGNAIVYDYVFENQCNVDFSKPNEKHRQRSPNRYLKRIRYGNRQPLLLDPDSTSFRQSHLAAHDLDAAKWMFEAEFDYGEGCYREELPDEKNRIFACIDTDAEQDWPVRSDPFSTYRSSFEIRTYRLCQRVLMFHNFSKELETDHYLVRSTAFHYHEKPLGSFINRIVQSGYKHQHDGRYLMRSLPPIDLEYTVSPLENPYFHDYTFKEVDPEYLANLPSGIDGGNYRWLDLNGESISGVLTEQGDAWFYKPNLGNGRFGAIETFNPRPSIARLSGGQQLMDLNGDGNLDLVDLMPPAPGFHERKPDSGWAGFRAFRSLPVSDWNDPNLRFVDLTGDGIADVLITEDDAFTWHASWLQEGFGPGIRVSVPLEEEKGARVIFADSTQSVYLADMSGDGLSDLVRIRNGEVCYWPNCGYGCFGAKVSMDNAPWFDEPDLFDQRRIHLADTDGSGTTDILYISRHGAHIFLNEAGNGWSSVRHLPGLPATDNLSSISVTDFLGNGTACLLWSSPLPSNNGRQLRYVDLMRGQKPHLLIRVANNLGAETRLEYTTSTEFYLADKAAGTPWVTKLPFPVHVVKRQETYDFISRNRFVSSYTYHHGFYDGVEREFRGFGRVEQLDTEEIGALTVNGNFPLGDNFSTASNLPPVLTKSWFHTGVFLHGMQISRHLAHEYYQEGGGYKGEARLRPEQIQAMLLEDTILPNKLTAEEAREACRSLKGSMLRQEVYALDGKEESGRPYMVSESNFTITPLQPQRTNRHAVFLTHARESLIFHYERKLYKKEGCRRADPRVSHSFVLEVDYYGNVLKSVEVGYGRRFQDPSPLLTAADHDKQAQLLLTLTENTNTNAVQEDDAYRTPLPSESRLYELINIKPSVNHTGVTNLFRFCELNEKIAQASDGCHDLPFEDWQAAGILEKTPYRRLLKSGRSVYRSNLLDKLLPLGSLEALGLPGESYKLALTPGLLHQVYQRRPQGQPPENLLPHHNAILETEGAYRDIDCNDHWWASSGRIFFTCNERGGAEAELVHALKHFFLPHRFQDIFGNVTRIEYDPHDLAPTESIDPVGNRVQAEFDYRVLAPRLMTDINGNRSALAFDTLGMVAGTAVMGKVGENLGDSLQDFIADLDESTLLAHILNPLANPHNILQQATTRLVYDLFAYQRSKEAAQPHPSVVYSLVRETHESDLGECERSKIQHAFSYSDGYGREIQKKIQAEPGPIVASGPKVNPRWVGSGWTIFNNKGKPIRQYEPFFDDTQAFKFAEITGVSPILFYDPVGRVVATLHPNHIYEKIVFDPWQQISWDVNDTVLFNPKQDPYVGDFFRLLPDSDYLPTWYQQRIDGALGAAEQSAAEKAAHHADTLTTAYFDSLGRPFLSIADNGKAENGKPLKFATRTVLDIENQQREVIDALDRIVMRYDYDMLGSKIHQASMEAGESWMLNDAVGKPIRAWNSRQYVFRTEYDALHRPVKSFVQGGDPYECDAEVFGDEILFEQTVYGDSSHNGLTEFQQQQANLRGKVYQHYDTAGVITTDLYDFKGNSLRSTRKFACDYKNAPDWSQNPKLETEYFSSTTSYDALNRAISVTAPDHSIYRPTFNEANFLETVKVNLRGACANGKPVWTPFVTNIDYNAKGQRTLIQYANGAKTAYQYDPLTFRLTRLKTTREACRNGNAAEIFKHADTVQELHYTFDPIGNITRIKDAALHTVFHANQQVEPISEFIYDPLYRLIAATGREHIGQSAFQFAPPNGNNRDYPFVGAASQGDLQALRPYTERYDYDPVGNFEKMVHRAANGNWSRVYSYDEASLIETNKKSNRLSQTSLHTDCGFPVESYSYDAHGNMLHMPHLPLMQWNFKDELRATSKQVVHQGLAETTYYVYDGGGQRVRKITEGQNGTQKNERRYLGGFEIYREYEACDGNIILERETLHVMDDKQRIALVETLTVEKSGMVLFPNPVQRYQLANHLGSASLELDPAGGLISYEDYSPYGNTSYQAGHSSAEVSLKRYRYTGKERDEENGFTYHGARYYAPWLGRWVSCDPGGLVDGLNLYRYARNAPIIYSDTSGRDPDASDQTQKDDQKLQALGITRQQLIDRFSMTNGDFIDKYGLRIWWNFPRSTYRELPVSMLARILLKSNEDQTVYLQPSGRQATNANETATNMKNFNPGTPIGALLSVGVRGVAAIVGASPEDTEKYAGGANAMGDVLNAGLAARGSASKGIVPTRGGAAYGPPTIYEPNPPGPFKPVAPPYGGLQPPTNSGTAANMRGFQNEAEVTRITGGRLARNPSKPNDDAIVRFTRANGQEGVARIDVFGLNDELILVGGPAKEGNMSELIGRLNDLKLAADSRSVKAIAYFTKDTGSDVLAKATKILGKENVRTFDRPTYKYP